MGAERFNSEGSMVGREEQETPISRGVTAAELPWDSAAEDQEVTSEKLPTAPTRSNAGPSPACCTERDRCDRRASMPSFRIL
jgi:hypothetical protein